jgi:hypothetical protein
MEFPEQISIGLIFFRFAYVVCIGFWQVLASFQGIHAFSLLPRGFKRRWGYLLGAVIMAAAGVWFFATKTEEIFAPGPASSEFLFFFTGALLCGLATCLAVSSARDALSASPRWSEAQERCTTEGVGTKWWGGLLYVPASSQGRVPAVVAVPEKGQGIKELDAVCSELASEGLGVLAIDLDSAQLWPYPDLLAAIPQAVALVERRKELDASRLGLLGAGLGGDLAIRAAASDQQAKAVVAISPILDQARLEPGLDLLRERSYLEAMRWRRLNARGDLVSQLDAGGHLPQLRSRSLLILTGEGDRVTQKLVGNTFGGKEKLASVPNTGSASLVEQPAVASKVSSWFREHL